MSTNNIDDDLLDDDPTAELPVLTDVIPLGEVEPTASMPGLSSDEDTGEFAVLRQAPVASEAARDARAASLQRDLDDRDARLAALEVELGRLDDRWKSTAAALDARSAEIERLRATLGGRERSLAQLTEAAERTAEEIQTRDRRIAALNDEAAAARAEADALEEQVRVLEQRIVELEAAHAAPSGRPGADVQAVQDLREQVAALSQHIENRNAIWRGQAAAAAAKATRVRELELELAQRVARQQAAERLAETEVARAKTLSQKLAAALAELEGPAPQPSRAAGGTTGPEAPTAQGPVQLREELARAIELQAQGGDDPQNLRRLEELETAIRELERQMDAVADDAAQAGPPQAPARLVCLTGESLGTYLIDRPATVIGRGAHCGIQITTHYVSREHARISAVNGNCQIEDLGSRNGVFVNSVRVERQVLADNDLVTIGDTQFRFVSDGRTPSG